MLKKPVSLKEEKKTISDFTGFIAYYDDGKVIKEQENFFSKKLNKQCATNWPEIDRNRLLTLELLWHNVSKARIDRDNLPGNKALYTHLEPSQWFFSQTGYLDLNSHKVVIIARNIGFVVEGIIHITTVVEDTGIIRMNTRAV